MASGGYVQGSLHAGARSISAWHNAKHLTTPCACRKHHRCVRLGRATGVSCMNSGSGKLHVRTYEFEIYRTSQPHCARVLVGNTFISRNCALIHVVPNRMFAIAVHRHWREAQCCQHGEAASCTQLWFTQHARNRSQHCHLIAFDRQSLHLTATLVLSFRRSTACTTYTGFVRTIRCCR